jgi:hypothetical protein
MLKLWTPSKAWDGDDLYGAENSTASSDFAVSSSLCFVRTGEGTVLGRLGAGNEGFPVHSHQPVRTDDALSLNRTVVERLEYLTALFATSPQQALEG